MILQVQNTEADRQREAKKAEKEIFMNDPMRREPWEPLNEYQLDAVKQIKDFGHELWLVLDNSPHGKGSDRHMALAKTNLEMAVMWAVKAVTAPREDAEAS